MHEAYHERMSILQRLMFGTMYRLGFTPWDGHPIPARVRAAAEATEKGRALDVGCGTGDTAIFLAGQGWDVTGVDFVQRALDRARAKAAAAGVRVNFVQADVADLDSAGIGDRFRLIVDTGLLHGLADDVRDAYVGHLAHLAAPGATLIIGAFPTGGDGEPRGIDRAEIVRRFAPDWELRSAATEEGISSGNDREIVMYELRRKTNR
jgi:SAM-dependent methyltransferase